MLRRVLDIIPNRAKQHKQVNTRATVQDRATRIYRGHPGAEALALRDLVEEAVKLAGDLLDPPHEAFLRRWVATGNIETVAREMGKDRTCLSRDYRLRIVVVVSAVLRTLPANAIVRCKLRSRAGWQTDRPLTGS